MAKAEGTLNIPAADADPRTVESEAVSLRGTLNLSIAFTPAGRGHVRMQSSLDGGTTWADTMDDAGLPRVFEWPGQYSFPIGAATASDRLYRIQALLPAGGTVDYVLTD